MCGLLKCIRHDLLACVKIKKEEQKVGTKKEKEEWRQEDVRR